MTSSKFKVMLDQSPYEIEQRGDLIVVNGQEFPFKYGNDGKTINISGNAHTISINGKVATVDGISYNYDAIGLEEPKESKKRKSGTQASDEAGAITAIMPGLIIKILKKVDENINAGETVLILEAMKMQNEIKAPKAGKIKKISVKEGETVEMRQVLAIVE